MKGQIMPATTGKVLVTGATGRQGGAVVELLGAAGYPVRAMTRDPESERARRLRAEGVEVVRADMTDRESMDRVMQGVDKVFAMATPFNPGGPEEEVVQGKTTGDAAAAAGVSHYVYSSVGDAERGTGIPHFDSKWAIEEHLRGLDLPLTVFRPVWFFENFTTFALQPTGDGYIVPMPLSPDTTLQGVAVRDVAAFVRRAFDDPRAWVGRELELAGDERTVPHYARGISAQIGKQVDYSQVSWDSVRAMGEDFYRMYDYFEHAGYHADIPELRDLHPQLRGFDRWLAEGGMHPVVVQQAA
jgi:uncharacterized protein YbjT (DUF2867 family)